MCLSHDKLRHPYTLDGMVWYGMVWYGMVTWRDGIGWDGMRWDGMYCARRSRAAGAPRLGEGWHSQVHVCPCHDKLRHPTTLDEWYGMVWDGMGW